MKYIGYAFFFLLYFYMGYKFFNIYSTFKGTDFKVIRLSRKNKKNVHSLNLLIFGKLLPTIILFIFGLIVLITYHKVLTVTYILPIILIPNSGVLLINKDYISNLFQNIETKDLNYIRIEKTGKLLMYMKGSNDKYTYSISLKNLDYLKESLRSFGYEVHIDETKVDESIINKGEVDNSIK